MSELKEKLLGKIKTGQLTIRPRWYFLLRTIALGGIGFGLGLVTMYFISFIAYSLQRTGLLLISGFGWPGISTLLFSSPWLIIGLALIFLFCLGRLVQTQTWGYSQPQFYSVLGLLLVVTVGTIVILQVPLHKSLEHRQLTAFLYERYAGHRPDGMYVGRLVSVDGRTLFLSHYNGQYFAVNLDQNVMLPASNTLKAGRSFVVFGQPGVGVVDAIGIRPIEFSVPLPYENEPPPLEHSLADSLRKIRTLFGTHSF